MGMLQKAETKQADAKKEEPKPDPPAAAPEATDEDKEPAADGEKPAEGGDSKDSE
jgi:hypothetical protein